MIDVERDVPVLEAGTVLDRIPQRDHTFRGHRPHQFESPALNLASEAEGFSNATYSCTCASLTQSVKVR